MKTVRLPSRFLVHLTINFLVNLHTPIESVVTYTVWHHKRIIYPFGADELVFQYHIITVFRLLCNIKNKRRAKKGENVNEKSTKNENLNEFCQPLFYAVFRQGELSTGSGKNGIFLVDYVDN